MQYHLNGYRGADPTLTDAAADAGGPLPDQVDVLIVGSGPAGLTLATQLSAFEQINTRIIDQKPGSLKVGQADGIACRSMEMFEAFGFADQILKEAYWVNETSFWRPDPAAPENIVRVSRIQDVEDGLSEMPHVILNQARVHEFFLDRMRRSPRRLEPHYGLALTDLRVNRDAPYPVTVKLRSTAQTQTGAIKRAERTIRARYVVGCDGARSSVRRTLGLALEGDSANAVWGVMDVLAITDFPDIRLKAAVQSASEGSILIIPREGGYLVRLYIEMAKLREGERASERHISAEQIIAKAKRIFHPYALNVKEIAWWSVYEIGQRLCPWFDNVPTPETADIDPNVFIVGDACHTHSPKAGQGMNVSMADAFNLGWKLASVLNGHSPPALLRTYSQERHRIARELIEFDRDMARLISGQTQSAQHDGEDAFQRYFTKHGRYTAGVEVTYGQSLITSNTAHQHLANGLKIGKRFHSAPVIRLADARRMQLAHTIKADGRWRLLAFAARDDHGQAGDGIARLCEFLSHSPDSPVWQTNGTGADPDSVIDCRAVFQQDHRTLTNQNMPALLLPRKGQYGLIDYEKVFCADPARGQDIYDMRGISRDKGCLVVVRPDQFVAAVFALNDTAALARFFDRILIKMTTSA